MNSINENNTFIYTKIETIAILNVYLHSSSPHSPNLLESQVDPFPGKGSVHRAREAGSGAEARR